MPASFSELIAERGVLVADGATGTNYQTMGLELGVAPEEWVFDSPERLQSLQADERSDAVPSQSPGSSSSPLPHPSTTLVR